MSSQLQKRTNTKPVTDLDCRLKKGGWNKTLRGGGGGEKRTGLDPTLLILKQRGTAQRHAITFTHSRTLPKNLKPISLEFFFSVIYNWLTVAFFLFLGGGGGG